MGDAPDVPGTTGAGKDEDSSSAAPARTRCQATPAPVRSANDQRVMTYMRNKIVELESKLKVAESELERSKSRPAAPFSRREEFLLVQLDLISRQLQGWIAGVLL